MTVQADYTIKPACCPNAEKTGTKTLTTKTPMGCIDLSFTDSGWTATLTLCGTLKALPAVKSGPGSVSPSSLLWSQQDIWDAQSIHVSADSSATGGQTIAVGFPTEYDLTASAKITGYGQTFQSATYTFHSVLGNPSFERSYEIQPNVQAPGSTSSSVASSPSHASRAPGIAPMASMVILVAAAILLRRRELE